MNHEVHVYQIDRDATPADRAQPASTFTVEADTNEDARRAAMAQLATGGQTVRSLSFLVGGGLAAVVTQPAPGPTSANVQRARRGR